MNVQSQLQKKGLEWKRTTEVRVRRVCLLGLQFSITARSHCLLLMQAILGDDTDLLRGMQRMKLRLSVE